MPNWGRVRQSRRTADRLMKITATGFTILAIFVLFWILGMLIVKGLGGLSVATFTQITPGPGSEGGGLANAIVGSLVLTFLGIVVATPIGVLAGTYLAEYGKGSKLADLIRFINDILLSAPSILIGLFVYVIMVEPLRRLFRLGRRRRARHHRDPGDRAHHRGHAAAGAGSAARGRLGARRAALRRHHLDHLAGGEVRHGHRHPAGARPHRRRDRAADLHRAEQQFLVLAQSRRAASPTCR